MSREERTNHLSVEQCRALIHFDRNCIYITASDLFDIFPSKWRPCFSRYTTVIMNDSDTNRNTKTLHRWANYYYFFFCVTVPSPSIPSFSIYIWINVNAIIPPLLTFGFVPLVYRTKISTFSPIYQRRPASNLLQLFHSDWADGLEAVFSRSLHSNSKWRTGHRENHGMGRKVRRLSSRKCQQHQNLSNSFTFYIII